MQTPKWAETQTSTDIGAALSTKNRNYQQNSCFLEAKLAQSLYSSTFVSVR
jgi:hypothetical protein